MIIRQLQTHIAYILEASDDLSILGMKTLKNIQSPYVLPASSLICNGKIQLMYHTEGMSSMACVEQELSEKMVRHVLKGLAFVLKMTEEKAFWEKEYIDIKPEHIYLNPLDGGVSFVILPCSKSTTGNMGREWLESLRQFCLFLMQNIENFQDVKFQRFAEKVHSIWSVPVTDSLDQFQKWNQLVEQIRKLFFETEENEDTSLLKMKKSIMNKVEVELRYRGIGGEFAFFISKPEFVIGKNQVCDGIININPAVSRKHCKIQIREEGCFVIDLGSSNHTYINEKQLQPNQAVQILQQDVLRIADMEFLIFLHGEMGGE